MDERLRQERDRVEQCLDIDSLDRIVRTIEQEMLEGNVESILHLPNGIDFIVENGRLEGKGTGQWL